MDRGHTTTISSIVRRRAEGLHRRRTIAGTTASLDTAIAEAVFLDLYGRGITIDDFDHNLVLRPTDDERRTLRIMVTSSWPARVYANLLDADVYVFAELPQQEQVTVAGWLTGPELEEAPIVWFERDGKRFSFAHEITKPFLIGCPTSFDFREGCPHLVSFGGLWDNKYDAFECCGCGRRLYDSAERQRTAALIAACHRRDAPRETSPEGMERPGDQRTGRGEPLVCEQSRDGRSPTVVPVVLPDSGNTRLF